MNADAPDVVQQFSFAAAPIHGYVVTLGHSWRTIRDRHPYAEPVAKLLGEMVVTVALLAQSLKRDGSIVLQTRGDGAVRSAMTECRQRRFLRGLARLRDESTHTAATGLELVGAGHLAITLQGVRGETYQGLVAIGETRLSRCVENYFATSEQLSTRLWVAASAERAAGMLLQRLPARATTTPEDLDGLDEHWRQIQARCDADHDGYVAARLLHAEPLQALRELFERETLRVTPSTPLEFQCGCSRERSSNALRLMGRDEVLSLIAEEQEVRVTCEFCGITYRYDPIDAQVLFEPGADGGLRVSH